MIPFSKISYDESREAFYYDFSADIAEATRRVSQAITDAQDERLKNYFKECFEYGVDYGSYDADRTTLDFEGWWAAFLNRLREEQRET